MSGRLLMQESSAEFLSRICGWNDETPAWRRGSPESETGGQQALARHSGQLLQSSRWEGVKDFRRQQAQVRTVKIENKSSRRLSGPPRGFDRGFVAVQPCFQFLCILFDRTSVSRVYSLSHCYPTPDIELAYLKAEKSP